MEVESDLDDGMGIGPTLTRVDFYDVVLEDMVHGGNLKELIMNTEQQERGE